MTKTFFSSDLHFFHRSICSFSPSRLDVLGLPFEKNRIKEMDDIRRSKTSGREEKDVAKKYMDEVVKSYNESLIEKWNDTIGFSDIVYCLGDVSFGKFDETKDILDRLHGRIHLVVGNHDHSMEKHGRFEWMKDYHMLNMNNQKIVLSHYPFAQWDCMHHSAWALHGHCHGSYRGEGKILDVGMESIGKIAIEFDEVVEYMKDHLIIPHNGVVGDRP